MPVKSRSLHSLNLADWDSLGTQVSHRKEGPQGPDSTYLESKVLYFHNEIFLALSPLLSLLEFTFQVINLLLDPHG